MKKVIVIGGGLGGLSAAISLAKYPEYDITLIEKNSHLGGKLNVLVKDGYSFDLGPSIFTMPHLFEPLFSMHGRKMSDYLELVAVKPHWRNFFEDGTVIDLTEHIEQMVPSKHVTFKDVIELHNFYNYTERLNHFTEKVLFEHQSETKLDTLKHYPWHRILGDSDFFRTMDQGVRKHISNPYLVDILNYFIKYVGSSPYDAPAVMNMLPYIQWKYGLWYVKDGMFNLSKGLTKLISELPIKVRTSTEVVGVEKEDGHINHVLLKDGTSIEADIIVSNMEAIPFYQKITQETPDKVKPYQDTYGPACSGYALHLGVDTTYPQLAHHNFFFSKDSHTNFDNIFHQHRLNDDPTIYLVAPMRTDPTQGPKGGDIIKILPHIPVVDPDHPFTKEEYEAFKQKILTKLERMGLTDLRKHIVTEEIWTPETIQETYYSNQGAIYGIVADKSKNMGFKTPKHSEFYDNLYFVGGSTNPGGGMPMVILSGQQVVAQIRKKSK